jgi:Zn finger protein HypA/HybF involved in hydrogenase expression
MPEVLTAGCTVSAGTYRCASCGYSLDVEVKTLLPTCPQCGNERWEVVAGSVVRDDWGLDS